MIRFRRLDGVALFVILVVLVLLLADAARECLHRLGCHRMIGEGYCEVQR